MEPINNSQQSISLTCQEMYELIKKLSLQDDELRNLTHEQHLLTFAVSRCNPKSYSGLQGISKWVVTIMLIVFLIFGLIGNILSATIMYRRARRGLSSYFYLALLAFVDICVLYSSGLLSLLEIAFDYQPGLKSSIYCRLAFYFQHLFTYISAWLIVAVTFERFIVVRFPFQSILICRMRVAHAVTLTIVLFFALYTAHVFFTVDLYNPHIHTQQGYHPNYTVCDLKIYQQELAFVDLCFYSFLPSICIIIFNILIISTMFYAIKQRRNYLQASSYLRTTDIGSRNVNGKNKSPSSTRTPFFRSRSVGNLHCIVITLGNISICLLFSFFFPIELTPMGRSYTPHARTYQSASNKTTHQPKSNQILFDSTSATGIRLTCLLLIISFIFVLCTSPMPIHFLLQRLIGEYKSTSGWQFTRIFFSLLMYLNHTVIHVLNKFTDKSSIFVLGEFCLLLSYWSSISK